MLTDEDRAWLKALHAELWPPKDTRSDGQKLADSFKAEYIEPGWKPDLPPEPRLFVFREELARIFQIVDQAPLVVELFCSGMFGGVGAHIYEHEQFVGTGPEHILSIAESQLPDLDVRTVYEHILGAPPRARQKSAGGCRDDAWEFFTKYAFTPKNLEWLKHYKMKVRMERTHYEY